MICALIMAGGKGSRFWPLSTEEKPKQFLNLIGNKTMIQMTVQRILPIIPYKYIFICTTEKYKKLVIEQLPDIPEENIIIEPEGRNTAPCITLSALIIERRYKNSKMIVLPSDHLIRKERKFIDIILSANECLDDNPNMLLTLGMQPNRAEKEYGYIKLGDLKYNLKEYKFYKVDRFVEKPDYIRAKQYLDSGKYLWNGGIFIWKTSTIIDKINEYCPEIYNQLKPLRFNHNIDLQKFVMENYKKIKSISIDYALLEKADNIFVIPSDVGWDDIGTWKALERYKEKDINNNIIEGNAKIIDGKSNIAMKSSKRVIMIGLKDTVALETKDSIYIVNKEYLGDISKYKTII